MHLTALKNDKRLNAARWAVLLAVLLVYANSFHNEFHFDDFHTVTDNPAVRSLHNVPRFFTDATTFSVLPANRTYRPVVSTSLAIDYMLGRGYNPVWFHIGTFLLFLLLVALLWKLYARLMDAVAPGERNAWLALLAAAWFGLHPVMAETVNYVIQRGDLYCTLGCVAALYLYTRRTQGPGWLRTWVYLLPLALALLSKPPAAVFPVLLFFYVFFFEAAEPGTRLRRSALAAVPSAMSVGLLLWLSSAMTPKTFAPSMISPADYRLTQPFVWLRYGAALILPLHLNVDTDLSPFTTLNLRMVAGLLFVAALCTAIYFTSRRRRLYPVAYGLIWFAVTQLPTSMYPLSETENDHRMFFSFVGLMLSAVWGGAELVRWGTAFRSSLAHGSDGSPLQTRVAHRKWLLPVATALCVLALAGYAYGTHVRNQVWRTEESLWLDDVVKSPHNGRGLMIYGLTQMNKGAYPAALDYFMRALAFTPNYASLEVNLGVVNGLLADAGDGTRTAEAEKHYLRAIDLTPGDDSPHAFYARWLVLHGRDAEAAAQARQAVTLNPARPFGHEVLIRAESALGDLPATREAAQATLAAVPGDALALQAMSHPEAVAVRGANKPYSPADALVDQSLTQARAGKFNEAIASARAALALDPHSAVAWNNIGAAYGSLGHWDEAIHAEQEAVRLDGSLQIAQNNLTWFTQQKSAGAAAPPQTAMVKAGGATTAADLLNESLALAQAGRYEDSKAAARAALQLDPKLAEAWNNIAAANEAEHHWDEAIAAAQKAVALKPDFQLAKNNLSWSLSQKQLGVR